MVCFQWALSGAAWRSNNRHRFAEPATDAAYWLGFAEPAMQPIDETRIGKEQRTENLVNHHRSTINPLHAREP
jgi:hypothetical protein